VNADDLAAIAELDATVETWRRVTHEFSDHAHRGRRLWNLRTAVAFDGEELAVRGDCLECDWFCWAPL
jgi:hypothetical protein